MTNNIKDRLRSNFVLKLQCLLRLNVIFEYTRTGQLTSDENFNTFKSGLKMQINIYVYAYFFKLSEISCYPNNSMISIQLKSRIIILQPSPIWSSLTEHVLLYCIIHKYVDRKEQSKRKRVRERGRRRYKNIIFTTREFYFFCRKKICTLCNIMHLFIIILCFYNFVVRFSVKQDYATAVLRGINIIFIDWAPARTKTIRAEWTSLFFSGQVTRRICDYIF